MAKGERRTPEQKLAEAEAAAAKARADMDRQAAPLGHILKRAETLSTADKTKLAAILGPLAKDKSETERLQKLLG